jgi:glycosyltransferase involved in cell wall biosynthesis
LCVRHEQSKLWERRKASVRALALAQVWLEISSIFSRGTVNRPCLVFSSYNLRLTDGGPSGFLAQNVVGDPGQYFELPKAIAQRPLSPLSNLTASVLKTPERTARLLGFRQVTPLASELIHARRIFSDLFAHRYPLIWFHDVMRLVGCADLLGPHQRVILQSHSPQLPSEELRDMRGHPTDVEWLKTAERSAFDRADVVVVPNEFVLPIYDSVTPAGKPIQCVLSGCRQLSVRTRIPLDPDYVYFCYIGRRSAIKGFDLVLDAFKLAHAKNNNLRLVVVGEGEALRTPGIIDVGRSEAPEVWLASVDYAISANRQSYFDLSVMEALSLGTPLIMCLTGGHRYYEANATTGICGIKEAETAPLAEAMLASVTKRDNNREAVAANERLYREKFTRANYRGRVDEMLAGLWAAGTGRQQLSSEGSHP